MRTKNLKIIVKKIIDIVLVLFSILIFLMFIYSIFYKIFGLYRTNYLYNTKNTKIIIAEDGIMEPDISKNDVVIIKSVKENELDVGDIIYYYENNSYKLSKIEVIKDNDNLEKSYIIRGNKNYYYNPENAKLENIEGKVVKSISGISLFFKIAISNQFTIFIVFTLIVIIITLGINKKKSIERRLKRVKIDKSLKK